MPRLSSIALRHELVRTFVFDSGGSIPVHLDVTLVYTPAEKLEDEQHRQTKRVIGNRRFSDFTDIESQQKAYAKLTSLVLAGTIRKIEGMTLRKLNTLIGLDDPTSLDLDAAMDLDPSDSTPLTDDELASFAKDNDMRDVKTKGQLAQTNIIDLINLCPKFKTWLLAVVSDVSFFSEISERLKN